MIKLLICILLYVYTAIVLIICMLISFLVFLYAFNKQAAINTFDQIESRLWGNRLERLFDKWDTFK